ncbi:MAG TPA: DNA repair protein RecO, partial [Chloroflexota bacterium]|nr:DNA repair protein RecO [Chloroflexota bacterium]
MRVHLYRTEAIVLDRKDFGEADRLLTLYTPGLGKVRAIAKGARRTTSRLSGHIELFTHTELLLATGRNLDIITQSQLIRSHEGLREDLWRAALGFHVLELVNHFSEERLENPAVWEALLEVLRRLDEGSEPCPQSSETGLIAETKGLYDSEPRSQSPELAVRFFEAQLLDHTGYRPELRCCTLCRDRLESVENYFHAPSGGLLCPHCAAGHAGLLPLTVDAIKVLRLLQDGELSLA